MKIESVVGPVAGYSDGNQVSPRLSRDGSMVVQDSHGQLHEATYRGKTYALPTAAAGVTIAAAHVFSSTAPAKPIVGIYNPAGSGVNAVLLFTKQLWASGTAAAEGLVLAILAGANVSAAGGNGAINLLTGVVGGSKVSTFTDSALTGQTVAHTLLDFIGGPTTGALAANASDVFMLNHQGVIFCPPGASLGIFAAAAGTSPIVAASMIWEEVPV